MDNKYKTGKIYKVTDVGYQKCYYGSTIEPLSQRMARHRIDYSQYKAGMSCKCLASFTIFDEYGVESCKIELVEDHPCESKEHLRKREGWYIQNNPCVNRVVAGRISKEYREQHVENIKELNKTYREKNKDAIKEYKEKHKDKINAYERNYVRRNRDKMNEDVVVR